ncbi:MAG: hypothetical protein J2O46_10610 [Nocardioides sp.]|nr:hypothetical protein [Nocardioides sp.]
MDIKLKIETISFVLLIVAFPVISVGSMHDNTAVWWLGLAAMILGGLLPIWTRFMSHVADKIRDIGIEFDDRTS